MEPESAVWCVSFRREFLTPLGMSALPDNTQVGRALRALPTHMLLDEDQQRALSQSVKQLHGDLTLSGQSPALQSLLRLQLYSMLLRLRLAQMQPETGVAASVVSMQLFKKFEQLARAQVSRHASSRCIRAPAGLLREEREPGNTRCIGHQCKSLHCFKNQFRSKKTSCGDRVAIGARCRTAWIQRSEQLQQVLQTRGGVATRRVSETALYMKRSACIHGRLDLAELQTNVVPRFIEYRPSRSNVRDFQQMLVVFPCRRPVVECACGPGSTQ